MSRLLRSKFPMSERLEIGLLPAMIGGFLDAYTYLCFDGVFANAQTGNMVLLSIALIDHNQQFVDYLVPICFFAIGILITQYFATHLIQLFFVVSLLVELLILSFIGFLPDFLPPFLTVALVSMISSIQLTSFKKICGVPYSSTMCTGNLRSSMEALYEYIHKKEVVFLHRFLCYGAIILFFCIGAVIGAISASYFEKRAVFVCCGFLLILLFLIIKEHFNPNKPTGNQTTN